VTLTLTLIMKISWCDMHTKSKLESKTRIHKSLLTGQYTM